MSEEEIYKMLLTENIEKFPLLNEIFAIRNNKFKINDYTIYVTGCISLDVINRAIEKVNYIDKLQKENEELKIDIDILKTDIDEHNIIYTDTPEFEENYISKDKIRNKIKELDKKRNYIHSMYTSNVLEELLGDDKDE